MARMEQYSAMKRRAKLPALNSVLKPETSSDSPSAKSKGVRLVSANTEVNQQNRSGGNRVLAGIGFDERYIESVLAASRGARRIRARLTS